ncbi:hypothetical protein SO802_003795 [Lithocarpus litseifolius]|uniref:Uncharacterized protein n=1 Tax=Lithocarpus litseifolius TaxID=425828 RepID=A0AAW2E6F1_9ROSI
MPEVCDGECNDQTEANETFQQEAISDVVPIDVEDNVQYCKGSIEVENILKGLGEQKDNNEDEVHNTPDSDMDPNMDYDIKRVQVQVSDDDYVPTIGDDELSRSLNNEMARYRCKESTPTVQHTGPSLSTHLGGDSLAQISTNVEAQLVGIPSTTDASTSRRARGMTRGLGVQGLVEKHRKLPVRIAPEFYAPVGEHAGKFASQIGVQQKMLRVQDKHCSTPEAQPLTEEEISMMVLKPRSGYVKGLGMRPSSSLRTLASSSSTQYTQQLEGLVEELQDANYRLRGRVEELQDANFRLEEKMDCIIQYLRSKGDSDICGSGGSLSTN